MVDDCAIDERDPVTQSTEDTKSAILPPREMLQSVQTYTKMASIKIPMTEAVLPPALTAEIMSSTNSTVQMAVLMTFMIKKASGFNLCLARRMISVIVRTRDNTATAIQMGTILFI